MRYVPAICCSQPSIPENSIILGSTVTSHFSPGQSLSLHCNDGFVLVGDATMTCKETGKWSQEPPRCVREEETCLNPGPLVNGKIKVSEGPHGVHVHLLGTQLQFSCDPLHFLAGHSKTTCQGNRTWSSPFPTCKKVITCGALEQFPSVRMRFVKPETAARTIKTFSQSNVMTRRTGKGRFRSNVRPQAAAPQPRHQADLEMILPEGFYHIGTQANFYCESPYYQLQGSQTRTCMNNGEWTGRPTTCTPICGISSDPVTPTVYGGSASSIGQWPWMVAINMIDDDGEHFFMCGGSLVDERWVITAAHCVTHENKTKLFSIDRFVFYAGKYHLDNSLDDKEVQVREAEAIHLHPDYNPKTFDSDLALIRLAQPVKLTSRVQPVCLPSTDPIKSQERMNNRRGVLIGWGQTQHKELSDVLLHVQIPFVPTDKCVQDYWEATNRSVLITSNTFCAGNEAGNQTSCDGDSGGPLVFPTDGSATKYVLEGVASWSSLGGCGNPKQYSAYVRVQNLIPFIQKYV